MDTSKDGGAQPVLSEQTAQSGQPDAKAVPSLRIGSVLRRSFSLLGQNPGVFLGLAFLAALPPTIALFHEPLSAEMKGITQLAGMILGYFVQGLTVYAVFQAMRGTVVTVGDSMAKGLAQPGALLLTALLVGIGANIGTVVASGIPNSASLLLQFGFGIIGMILACMWEVIIPVCVAERLGPAHSMRRSMQLTKGYRWPIFGLMLIIGMPLMAFALVLGFAGGAEAFLSGNNAGAVIIIGVIGMLTQAFHNVMAVVIYHDLWAIKENQPPAA